VLALLSATSIFSSPPAPILSFNPLTSTTSTFLSALTAYDTPSAPYLIYPTLLVTLILLATTF